MKIVSVEKMIQLEKDANENGLSYEKMKRNAGNGIAAWICEHLNLQNGIVGLVGSGNNGGDTLIALAILSRHNVRTFAFLVKSRDGDPLITEYQMSGGTVISAFEDDNFTLLETLLSEDVIVLDGILGTGFRLPLSGNLAALMGKIHTIVNRHPEARLIAVDCPSGVDCDTGEVSVETLRAKTTLTMAAVKQGLLKYPARGLTGDIKCIEIGIPIIASTSLDQMLDSDIISALLPSRPESGHKGTFGTCLVIAGTKAYTGAAFLTGKAAYRSGCGLVNVATVNSVRNALAGNLIEAVWTVLPEQDGGFDPSGIGIVEPIIKRTNALIVGPGLGLLKTNADFLEKLVSVLPLEIPLLVDADGLKLLTNQSQWWSRLPKSTVLTPHPGEMSILTKLSINEIEADRWEITRAYAKKWGVTVVLKGAMTVIGSSGGSLYINPVCDSALATAGSGDVLSGIIGGLLAQGISSETAAILGVWLHGEAGVNAHKEAGNPAGVTALDILDQVNKR